MSHLDELDEFEAELELRLKREYTAVFGLFRYCVLTQDATYLCNKLELTQISQPAYPFFHLKMEDVWVWDKNRPTRIIPRAEAWTSGDVTVEELRAEGEEPRQGNLDVIDELLDSGYVGHDPAMPDIVGREGAKQFYKDFLSAYPDG